MILYRVQYHIKYLLNSQYNDVLWVTDFMLCQNLKKNIHRIIILITLLVLILTILIFLMQYLLNYMLHHFYYLFLLFNHNLEKQI